MLEEIGDVSRVPEYIKRAKDKNDRFMLKGFGHRIVHSVDPRAEIMRKLCVSVLRERGMENDRLFTLAQELERIVLEDDYFIERKLFPNVYFYSGIVQKAIGIPPSMFPCIIALAHTVGWIAQWEEMITAPDHKIGRPRQLYIGHARRDVPDIDIKGLDQAIMRIVNERIRLQPGMDPILTVILIQKVLDAAAKGDTALAAELEESIKMIAEAKKGGLDLSVPWHDPTRKDADKVRVTARKFMVGFPGLKDVAAKAQERREKLSKQLTASRHQFLGWMYQDPEAGWQVVAMQPQLKTRPIQTLEFQDGKPLGWTTIGEVNPAGAVTLRPEAKSALKDGRLVFVPVE